jgi:hypothetical protein
MPVINLACSTSEELVDYALHQSFRIGYKKGALAGFLIGFGLASLSATLILLWVRP